MPPAPPAPPAGPPGAGAGKRLPLWAWALAGAAGLLIGFFLLRRTGTGDGGETETDVSGRAAGGGDGGGAPMEPLTQEELQALGLQPSTFSSGGSTPSDTSVPTDGRSTVITSLASTAAAFTGAFISPTYQGGAAAAAGFSPFSSPAYIGGGLTDYGYSSPAVSGPGKLLAM